MTTYLLFKLKPGKRTAWEAWCHQLMTTHRDEALVTLVEEDLVQEQCELLGEGDESYVLYKHVTVKGKEKKKATDRELNHKHFQTMNECLKRVDTSPLDVPHSPRVVGYDLRV